MRAVVTAAAASTKRARRDAERRIDVPAPSPVVAPPPAGVGADESATAYPDIEEW